MKYPSTLSVKINSSLCYVVWLNNLGSRVPGEEQGQTRKPSQSSLCHPRSQQARDVAKHTKGRRLGEPPLLHPLFNWSQNVITVLLFRMLGFWSGKPLVLLFRSICDFRLQTMWHGIPFSFLMHRLFFFVAWATVLYGHFFVHVEVKTNWLVYLP